MISVIVTEYFDRGFLKDALSSVFSQTLDKNLYEVIVVKRDENKDIDNYAIRNGAKIIYEDSPQLGRRIFAGIEESQGDIITFLEDDDKYSPERLAYIYKIFQSTKIGGFRNLYYNIDEKGNIVGKEKPFIDKDEIVDAKNYKFKRYYKFLGGNSSIALRKELITEEIKKLELALDIYFAITSICSQGYYYTSNYFTYYRIHTQNTSMSKDLIGRTRFSLRNFSDFQFIYEKYKNCSKEIEKTVRFFLLSHKMQLSIYSLFAESSIPRYSLSVNEKLLLLNPAYSNRVTFLKILLLSLPSKGLKRKIFRHFYAI